MNATLEVFDPAMCCSTGVCGPSVDPRLARFAADLDWLKGQGVAVRRYNLSQEPGAFAEREPVRAALDRDGEAALPLIFMNGKEVSRAAYPARESLAQWAGMSDAKSAITLYTPAVAELVAIGAAIGSNCEPCFKYHYDQARKLGVSNADMLAAVHTAQAVKETPARDIFTLAERVLISPDKTGSAVIAVAVDKPKSGSCCGSSTEEPKSNSTSKCC
jgi:AhpD family alkylhydroperoxidase